MRTILRLAGLCALFWAAAAIFFPVEPFRWAGMTPPAYPELWQLVGLLIGIYGVVCLAASADPMRHWPVVLAGFLGQVLIPIGLLLAVRAARLSGEVGWTLATVDLVWVAPFAVILKRAHSGHIGVRRTASPAVERLAMEARTQDGRTIAAISERCPVLLVFLRHLGCTFCREAISDLARHRRRIEAMGTGIVLVHMAAERRAEHLLRRYGLDDLSRISDPQHHLYRAFGLRRGALLDLFGPHVIWRGFRAMVFGGHRQGRFAGDGFQMPGVFLLFHGEVIRSYRHQSAADRPDYVALADAE